MSLADHLKYLTFFQHLLIFFLAQGDVSSVTFILRMCWYLMKHNVSAREITVLSVNASHAYKMKEVCFHLLAIFLVDADFILNETNLLLFFFLCRLLARRQTRL